MIDVARVAEIRSLPTKEAKEGLIEYAKEFGIDLKSRPYDKMVEDLKAQLEERANEPMPEQEGGLTMAELIAADDAAQGKFVDEDEVNEQAAQLLIDSVAQPELSIEDIKHAPPEEPLISTITIHPVTEPQFITLEFKIDKPEDVKVEEYQFPKNYSPSLSLIGNNPGYISLQWWVFDFIQSNPNWKSEIELFKHESGKKDLYSLLYYIQRNGSVRIRETKNSRFHDLT